MKLASSNEQSAHPRTNATKEEGKGKGKREGNAGGGEEGRGTDGLEVTGSDRRCLTTVAHTSSLLKPDKGPTCNVEREREKEKEQIETKKERERKQEAARFLFGKAGGSTD